ncbi:MAG: hypothetical protein ACM3PZ_00760 [Bacillota bacterium]
MSRNERLSRKDALKHIILLVGIPIALYLLGQFLPEGHRPSLFFLLLVSLATSGKKLSSLRSVLPPFRRRLIRRGAAIFTGNMLYFFGIASDYAGYYLRIDKRKIIITSYRHCF